MRVKTLLLFLVVLLLPVLASSADPPCLTAAPAFITLTVAGTVTPIISSGDTCGEFLFTGLPDGIGLAPGTAGPGSVDVYVAHEETQ